MLRLNVILALTVFGLCVSSFAGIHTDLTNLETAPNGEHICAYGSGDTISGSIRSNGMMGLAGNPVIGGPVILAAPDFYHCAGFAPMFSVPPEFDAMPAALPMNAEYIRQCAQSEGHYYSSDDQSFHVSIRGSTLHMWRWYTGSPEDSIDNWTIPISYEPGTCIFADGPLIVEGSLSGRLTVASSQTIRIVDNVMYADAQLPSGQVQPNSQNMLGIVSAADVKIANTPANGRENSHGEGPNQPNPRLTDVTITAAIVAGGSFTFEQQNDPDSGYVCDCVPDNRGTIYLWGGFTQEQRGYFHRSTNQFTGYHVVFQLDARFFLRRPPGFFDVAGPDLSTDTLDFGDVPVQTTAWDTADVYTGWPSDLGSVMASAPFHSLRVMPFQGTHFTIPTRFTPPHSGPFNGILHVTCDEQYFDIVLKGRGVIPSAIDGSSIRHPSSFILSASPNPFNATTEIRYALPSPGLVTIEVFDLQGRRARTLIDARVTAGDHRTIFDAHDLPSGVYFARLRSASGFKVQKLLLLK